MTSDLACFAPRFTNNPAVKVKSDTQNPWTAQSILDIVRGYQAGAVLVAAAELDLFTVLASGSRTASELAQILTCDLRAVTVLLDALAAQGLLQKSADAYSLPAGLAPFLTPGGERSLVAMLQHQANCLRNWSQLAKVTKTGKPAERIPSVRGEAGDKESFIGAMHNVSDPNAAWVIQAIQPLEFKRLLDIGGASGTWTMAFLRACPAAQATLFDLPHVIPMAKRRLEQAGLAQRVRFAPGDFMADALPSGADLAWVSAIVHQNSREQNRLLFSKVFSALSPGGRIAIRDMLVDETRTRPVAGAFFAVNMLVATAGGGTFTYKELNEDLQSAGFAEAVVAHQDEGMNSVLVARKPAHVRQ
jgi:predicted O-methyltransferase YrrM